LQGEKTFTIVEKSFMTANTFKKYSNKLKSGSPSSGIPDNTANKIRFYHAIVS
jgi:hypothetical protein